MIIGLTGKNAAGKGEVAKYLVDKGFEYHSLSDVLRDELRKRRLKTTRVALTKLGNRLRSRFGPGVLAERIGGQLRDGKNYVVDSFRNPEEVNVLRKRDDFHLLLVKAPARERFVRIKKRGREADPSSYSDFLRVEKREGKNADSSMQNLDACAKMADSAIVNDGTLAQLHASLDHTLVKALMGRKRPGWDEYFMGIAYVVASRSNCLKRRVAAIIVKDKRIISTGYNGTPRGTKNCGDGGCPRCRSMASSGTRLDECYCSHGEENAIVQAAYHGICIKDGTLYTTYSPCLICAKMAINAGIREIVYSEQYPLAGQVSKLLKQAKVKLRRISN